MSFDPKFIDQMARRKRYPRDYFQALKKRVGELEAEDRLRSSDVYVVIDGVCDHVISVHRSLPAAQAHARIPGYRVLCAPFFPTGESK